MGTLPKIVQEAISLLGTRETPGPANNALILKWAQYCGLSNTYSADSVPWCGLFVAYVVKKGGKTPVAQPLWARNWSHFGSASPSPSLGDILVFVREGGGHVGIYIAEDDTAYHVLGGNQSDAVTITRIAKSRCVAVRRPPYNNKPESVKPYHVAGTGALSTNES